MGAEPTPVPDGRPAEVAAFWVQGVVRDGQVVLDPPLGLPDGTVVTVTHFDPDDDPGPQRPPEPFDPAKARAALFAWAGRPELADDPDWRAKLRGGR